MALLGVGVPHDGFHLVAGAIVVQTVFSTCQLQTQAASPKRSGAAPARADVVLHKEFVLHHIGVRPDGLVGKFRQTFAHGDSCTLCIGLGGGIYPVVVGAGLP